MVNKVIKLKTNENCSWVMNYYFLEGHPYQLKIKTEQAIKWMHAYAASFFIFTGKLYHTV